MPMFKRLLIVTSALGLALLPACSSNSGNAPAKLAANTETDANLRKVQQGDLSLRKGTATVREEFKPQKDDPKTTNDERNDQPVGHFGNVTLSVHNERAGRTYTLDADVEDADEGTMILHRLYFPKGGWIDFPYCELDEDYIGRCTDEEGRDWTINSD